MESPSRGGGSSSRLMIQPFPSSEEEYINLVPENHSRESEKRILFSRAEDPSRNAIARRRRGLIIIPDPIS
jgi:hypothetical protein